jgi:hypothetical protein
MQILYRHLDPIATQYHSDLLYLKKLANYQPSHISKVAGPALTHDKKGMHSSSSSSTHRPSPANNTVKFVLPRSILCALPGDVMFFSSVLPKSSNEVHSYVTDNANTNSQQFGPAPPRRVTSIKVTYSLSLFFVVLTLSHFFFFAFLSLIPLVC